jgi:hypothetical protein
MSSLDCHGDLSTVPEGNRHTQSAQLCQSRSSATERFF